MNDNNGSKTPPNSVSDITLKATKEKGKATKNGKTTKNKDNEKKKTGIYLEKTENIEFFISSFRDETDFVVFDGITAISESAFANSDAENILFKGKFSSIRKSAFENCDKLKTVIFGELVESDEKDTSPLKNVKPASAADFTIQTNAFKGCSSLTTLILPKIRGKKTLTIEKDAFSGCEKLRAVVAICGKADFTGNPFSGCPAHLTFVCKKNSKVDRFARENGYRSVYAD